MKKFATLISWISLITIIVIEVVLYNMPDKIGGNIIVMVSSTPVLTCSIVAVTLSSKNRSSIWWKIGLSSVVFIALIVFQIGAIQEEDKWRESERLMRAEEARESEENDDSETPPEEFYSIENDVDVNIEKTHSYDTLIEDFEDAAAAE